MLVLRWGDALGGAGELNALRCPLFLPYDLRASSEAHHRTEQARRRKDGKAVSHHSGRLKDKVSSALKPCAQLELQSTVGPRFRSPMAALRYILLNSQA